MSDGELVDLAAHHTLVRIAKSAGVSVRDAVRLMRAIAAAEIPDGDAVIAWTVREQQRVHR